MTYFTSNPLISLLLLLLSLLTFSSSQTTYTCSRATYYGSPECSGTPSGSCGYGELGRELNGGDVGAVARLYRNGTGCGRCYQVRCSYPQLCKEEGVKIVVTDHGESDHTDFIMSARGFVKLARPNMAAELMAYGVIDVEFKRISCQYPNYNMMLQIKEQSRFPDYLALIIIYHAGKKDITAVQLWQDECKEWKPMRQAYGAVWDMVTPPRGPINVRILTENSNDYSDNNDNSGVGSDGQKWIQLTAAIPYDWKAGVTYDTATDLN